MALCRQDEASFAVTDLMHGRRYGRSCHPEMLKELPTIERRPVVRCLSDKGSHRGATVSALTALTKSASHAGFSRNFAPSNETESPCTPDPV